MKQLKDFIYEAKKKDEACPECDAPDFDEIDTDGDGMISKEEFDEYFKKSSKKSSKKEEEDDEEEDEEETEEEKEDDEEEDDK